MQTLQNKSRVWGRHSPTSTTGQCATISNFEIVATGRYLLIAFPVQNENTDFKLELGFQSWECFRRSLVRLTCADERDTDREIQTRRVYERSECAVLGLNFVPRGDIRGKEFLSRVCGQKWVPPKACQRHANRSVSYCGGRRLHRICVPAPVFAAALSGSPAFCAGSWRSIQIQTAHVIFKVRNMKNCRPVARLQILSGNKESRPAGDQRILSGASGGKMVRCGCGAAVYHSKVACMGKRISWEGRSVKRKEKCC